MINNLINWGIERLLNYYSALLGWAPGIIIFGISLFFHEIGHYVVAKREGIYVGWVALPQPHIKMKRALSSRWKYLAGFLFSLIALPFWCVAHGLESAWVFIILQMGAAGADLVICIFYGYFIKKKHQERDG